MARPKKVKVIEEAAKVEETPVIVEQPVELPKFPYTVKLNGARIIVVGHSKDAKGALLLNASDGCTYHAE